ncbi:hypothetical protein [Streptomyces sp. NPDC005374]|uniref:hypothetical protein n=1 Tax=Streptomyces sp. NPDC005374 TaxID=3364713 RepID=UPI0036C6E526
MTPNTPAAPSVRSSPLRHLHRTLQRCRRRPRLPRALPLRGLRTLPRTDVSYLPDLEAYLADLLRNRERLAAFANADPWATAEATPSDDEIARIRRLVQRVRQDLDELTDEDRAQIREAVALVRRSRGVSLGMPRVRQPLPDLRPERTG